MKIKATIASIAAVAALALAGTAGAQILSQGTEQGSGVQTTFLAATDNTTAFTLGSWQFFDDASHDVAITATYVVDCLNPVNDRQGQVQLDGLRDDEYVWVGNRSVGSPWLGWDTCTINVTATVNFAEFGDPGFESAFAVWVNSHNGR